ncbi:molybdenum cofactor biosynthesis protein MoaE [candidate division TA06 bacterium]|nr:molybdenum cofactor biosynthesis protein MoaE [candidate division TA06 bacterium]
MFRITREDLCLEELVKAVESPEVGAIATFSGTTRNHSEGRKVLSLEYETFEGMAEKKLREIGEEIKKQWRVKGVAIAHRIGRIEVGEASVMIAVSASHRKEAFEACRYAIDRVKTVVPIWKKEFFEDGERWVEGKTPNTE